MEGLCATMFCTSRKLGRLQAPLGLNKSEASPHLTPETILRVGWGNPGQSRWKLCGQLAVIGWPTGYILNMPCVRLRGTDYWV